MGLVEHESQLHITHFSIVITELPALLQRFIRSEPTTQDLETFAASVIAGGFTADDTADFVRRVCRWGGYAGVAGRVLKNTEIATLRASLAVATTDAHAGKAGSALRQLMELKGLALSFASKHLKFLAPDRAVVLDSVVSSHLGYPLTYSGYADFLADCHTLRDMAQQLGVEYPGWGKDGWRVSDIEMAIFEKLRS
jgi:hypothetical protein